MPPKSRGGGKRPPPPPPFTDADVLEFRSVTGAGEAQARRALQSARGNLALAVNRHIDFHGAASEPAERPAAGKLTQANLHEAKRLRADPAAPAERPAPSTDDLALARRDLERRIQARPQPNDGWARTLPSDVEARLETRETTLAWASLALAPSSAPPFEDRAFPPDASSIDGRGKRHPTSSSAPPPVNSLRTTATKAAADAGPDATAFPAVLCHCHAPAKIREVYKDGPNQGRSFYGCAGSGVRSAAATGRCSFFRWADDAPSSAAARGTQWRRFAPPRFKLAVGDKSRDGDGDADADSERIPGTTGNSTGNPTGLGRRRFLPSDVRQGAVGDCWLLSALAVVAERRDLVERVVGPAGDGTASPALAAAAAAAGAHVSRLFLAGRWRGVLVDNHLPIRSTSTKVSRGANAAGSRGSGDEYAPAYSRAARNQLWVPLVEKAYAKSHGCYDAISGGWISEGLLDLTGCPTETLDLERDDLDADAAWAKMLSFAEMRFPMGCATRSGGMGIVGGHAYSVMEVRELAGAAVGRQTKLTAFVAQRGDGDGDGNGDGDSVVVASTSRDGEPLRLLRVRNPWGRKEWNGEWGTGSEVWTSRLGAELGHTRADDGTFWMSWRDFLARFAQVDVCKAHEGWHAVSLPATRDAAFEVEADPDHPGGDSNSNAAAAWTYVMALQPTKRGRGRDRFWYSDLGVAVYRSTTTGWTISGARPRWEPIGGVVGSRERVAQTEVMFEPGARYLVQLYSLVGDTSQPRSAAASVEHEPSPATVRLFSSRPLRARPAASAPPSLASAVVATLLAEDPRWRTVTRLCGGAVVVFRARGGVYVVAVCDAPAGSPPLRVRVRVRGRSVGNRAAPTVMQHPPPEFDADRRRGIEDARRYVPPGEGTIGRRTGNHREPSEANGPGVAAVPRSDGASDGPLDASHDETDDDDDGFATHEIPSGRARILAAAVSSGPSDARRHAVEMVAKQVGGCAACEARKVAEDGVRAPPEIIVLERDEDEGEDEGEDEANRDAKPPDDKAKDDDDVRIVREVFAGGIDPLAEFGVRAPPGMSDEALAAAFAEAMARAAADAATSGVSSARGRDAARASEPARAPPRRLAMLFAHVPASREALEAARQGRREGCRRCAAE